MNGFMLLFSSLRAFFLGRAAVAVEMLALQQQLAVLRHSVKRPRLRQRDRIFWILLSRFWQHWQSHLVIVQPTAVIRWHREGSRSTGNGNLGPENQVDPKSTLGFENSFVA